MPRVFEGGVTSEGNRYAVIVSQFNQTVTKRLLAGALDCFRSHGADPDRDVDVYYCPGAFEIPAVASRIAGEGAYDAIVCLGAIIRGETPHFEYIAEECASGVGTVARETNVPVLFGVLTTDTIDQAMERSGGSVGNKGWDAALGAISMANLYSQLVTKPKRN
ncbi:MAG TPA: 6,7-dimethyl-8-ribityllumazine synthase [Bacteroidota bacterium]|nr:6,7-dimethyl-8-ribityllumazine synthase [Bacteroidota bacterium]